MGRLERVLGEGPLREFAQGLRELRAAAGSPPYRELARIAHVSQSTLSAAASGHGLPTWEVTAAYVRACGGDVGEWRTRWRTQQSALRPAGPGAPAGVVAVGAPPREDSAPGAPAITALAKGEPRRVGRFRLLGRLGVGTMGVVYLGTSPAGRPVAVKVIRPEYADDEVFRRRFAAELGAVRSVSGGHTPAFIDADTRGPRPWMATAFVSGPSLAQAVERDAPLPEAAVWALAAGIAEALAAIHRAGIVHRDLKPSNVLLDRDGPKVIDFGICRALDDSTLTHTGGWVGTAGYTAPERAAHGRSLHAGDVFALGAALAYAATGHPPFGQGPVAEVLYRVVHQSPAPQSLAIHDRELRTLIEQCLAKDPDTRPTAAEVLARCTRHARHGAAALAAASSPSATARERDTAGLISPGHGTRRVVLTALLAALTFALVTGATLATTPTASAPQSAPSPAITAASAQDPAGQIIRSLTKALQAGGARAAITGGRRASTVYLDGTYYDPATRLTADLSLMISPIAVDELPPHPAWPLICPGLTSYYPAPTCTFRTLPDGGTEMTTQVPSPQDPDQYQISDQRADGTVIALTLYTVPGTTTPTANGGATLPGTLAYWQRITENITWHN